MSLLEKSDETVSRWVGDGIAQNFVPPNHRRGLRGGVGYGEYWTGVGGIAAYQNLDRYGAARVDELGEDAQFWAMQAVEVAGAVSGGVGEAAELGTFGARPIVRAAAPRGPMAAAEVGEGATGAHWTDFLGEASRRLDAVKAEYPNSGGVVAMAGQGKQGHATVRFYETRTGHHVTVEVKGLETEMTKVGSTTFIDQVDMPFKGSTYLGSKRVHLSDTDAAFSYVQTARAMKQAGAYCVETNSCRTYVENIVMAGGGTIPPSPYVDLPYWFNKLKGVFIGN